MNQTAPKIDKPSRGRAFALRYAFRVVVLLGIAWTTFTAVLFMMWGTGIAALIGLLLWMKMRRKSAAFAGLLLVAVPAIAIQFAVPEVAEELDAISCRVRVAHNASAPRCAGVEVDADRSGPLLTSRQHAAIRWLNLNMAIGGWLLGQREVAGETLTLDLLSSKAHQTDVQSESIWARRRHCRKASADAPTETDASDFAMHAPAIRTAAAKLASRTRDGQHQWKNVQLPGYRSNPWHVVLALMVPDARLHAEREGEMLHMRWRGTILYPMHEITRATLPRPVGGPYTLVLDEAFFCGAQMDGVFVPYFQEWMWDMPRNDPRMEDPSPSRRIFEEIARAAFD